MQTVKNHLQNNRGATSVLIMIMMIILMVFGVAALTTSAASRKLARKNAMWLTEYYGLQGRAQTAYAYLDEALNLAAAGDDIDRIEATLNHFLRKSANFSFQKTDIEKEPFIINMKVKELDKEIPKEIQMCFILRKSGDRYYLKTTKWLQYQADIFNPDDELRFSDIKIE